jgi:hypothetical protein
MLERSPLATEAEPTLLSGSGPSSIMTPTVLKAALSLGVRAR